MPDLSVFTGLDPNSADYRKASYEYNSELFKEAATPIGRSKCSADSQDQIAHYTRENPICDRIIIPTSANPAECLPGHKTDALYQRIYLTPEVGAMLTSFESVPVRTVEAFVPRIFLSFILLSSPTVVFNEYNLAAYPFPITKQYEQLIGSAIRESKDFMMISAYEQGIQLSRGEYGNVLRGVEATEDIAANGIAAAGEANTDIFRGNMHHQDIVAMEMFYTDSRADLETIVMTKTNWTHIKLWTTQQVGDNFVSTVIVKGIHFDSLSGHRVLRTIKSDASRGDVFKTGNLYGFANGELMGRNVTLRDLRFHFDSNRQFMSMDAQYAFGFIWAILSRAVKMELYNGGERVRGNTGSNPMPKNGTDPGSDERYTDVASVTTKDYYDLEKNFRRPRVLFN